VDSGPFQCPECSKQFTTQDELDQHNEQVHPMAAVAEGETQDSSEDAGAPSDGDSPETREGNPGRQY